MDISKYFKKDSKLTWLDRLESSPQSQIELSDLLESILGGDAGKQEDYTDAQKVAWFNKTYGSSNQFSCNTYEDMKKPYSRSLARTLTSEVKKTGAKEHASVIMGALTDVTREMVELNIRESFNGDDSEIARRVSLKIKQLSEHFQENSILEQLLNIVAFLSLSETAFAQLTVTSLIDDKFHRPRK